MIRAVVKNLSFAEAKAIADVVRMHNEPLIRAERNRYGGGYMPEPIPATTIPAGNLWTALGVPEPTAEQVEELVDPEVEARHEAEQAHAEAVHAERVAMDIEMAQQAARAERQEYNEGYEEARQAAMAEANAYAMQYEQERQEAALGVGAAEE